MLCYEYDDCIFTHKRSATKRSINGLLLAHWSIASLPCVRCVRVIDWWGFDLVLRAGWWPSSSVSWCWCTSSPWGRTPWCRTDQRKRCKLPDADQTQTRARVPIDSRFTTFNRLTHTHIQDVRWNGDKTIQNTNWRIKNRLEWPAPTWHHKWECPPRCTLDRSAYQPTRWTVATGRLIYPPYSWEVETLPLVMSQTGNDGRANHALSHLAV